jgi:hypothetical protein
MPDDLERHLAAVVPGIAAGRVVPLLGAGVNMTGRPSEWDANGGFLPMGFELYAYLAKVFEYPTPDDYDLPRLGQYVEIVAGRGTLYDELRRIFDRDYEPTPVHRFIAALPALMRENGRADYHLLTVTTNYDDLMERAFAAAAEPVDVVWYLADGDNRGKFMHRADGGEVHLIDDITTYRRIDLEKRSVVLKLHGSVDRRDRDRDSYVITISDYLEYLVRADIVTLLPVELVEKLYRSHFLFLGYGLRDWNLQVILHRIWGEQQLATKSWAVLIEPTEVDRLLWQQRNVDLVDGWLADYIPPLEERVAARVSRV